MKTRFKLKWKCIHFPLVQQCYISADRVLWWRNNSAVHQRNLGSLLALRERNRISDSLELIPEPMTPFFARGNRAKMASVKQEEEDNQRESTTCWDLDFRWKQHLNEASELTENGVDLVRVKCAALRLEGRSATSSTSQVAVHQRVHVKHAHQQCPCHCRGRLCLICCLPGADVTENTGTWIHFHLAHLNRQKPGEADLSHQSYVPNKMVNKSCKSVSV